MNISLASLSTDLRRVSYWILDERYDLVEKMVKNMKLKYSRWKKVGRYPDIWAQIDRLESKSENKLKKAELATTLGSILLQEAYKK